MGTAIPSSSLAFTTRQYYVENTPDTAKDDTLTFEDLDKTLLFLSSSITSIEGTYSSSFPDNTETPKAVGGINSGSTAGSLKGNTFSQMFDLLLFPVINPTSTQGTFSSTTGFTYKEIGDIINVTVTSTFTQGTWTVVGQDNRNYYGAATTYFYSSSADPEFPNGLNSSNTFTGYTVSSGTNNFPTAVSYSIGDQPINSDGSYFGDPIAAGKLIDLDVSFTGIYPWFYGSSSAATLSVADVVTAIENIYNSIPTNAVRNVELSNGTITANYPNTTAMWCWFATPQTSTTKQKWFESQFSQGPIGGSGGANAFNAPSQNQQVDTYINNVEYKIYISGYKTTFLVNAGTVQFQNS